MVGYLIGDGLSKRLSEDNIVVGGDDSPIKRSFSIVLTLGTRFAEWIPTSAPLDLWAESPSPPADQLTLTEADSFVLPPQGFVLCETSQRLRMPSDLLGELSSLSHLARAGLTIHNGSVVVSPGFGLTAPTKLALEICNFNVRPLILRAKMPIAHLRLFQLAETAQPNVAHYFEGRDALRPSTLRAEMEDFLQ